MGAMKQTKAMNKHKQRPWTKYKLLEILKNGYTIKQNKKNPKIEIWKYFHKCELCKREPHFLHSTRKACCNLKNRDRRPARGKASRLSLGVNGRAQSMCSYLLRYWHPRVPLPWCPPRMLEAGPDVHQGFSPKSYFSRNYLLISLSFPQLTRTHTGRHLHKKYTIKQ